MLKQRLSLAMMLTIIAIFVWGTTVVYAPWSTLGTGYAVTSNVHGIEIFPGTLVNVTAGTLDPGVYQVTFKWNAPDGTTWIDTFTPLVTNGSRGTWAHNGTEVEIRYAWSTYTPNVIGDWGVKVLFQGPDGTTKENLDEVVKIRATSFNVIPEVPFGTIAILLGMFGALGVLALKKKHGFPITMPF